MKETKPLQPLHYLGYPPQPVPLSPHEIKVIINNNKNSKSVILHIYYTIQPDARYSLVDEHVL